MRQKDKTKRINITIPLETLKKLDDYRGKDARSKVILDSVKKTLCFKSQPPDIPLEKFQQVIEYISCPFVYAEEYNSSIEFYFDQYGLEASDLSLWIKTKIEEIGKYCIKSCSFSTNRNPFNGNVGYSSDIYISGREYKLTEKQIDIIKMMVKTIHNKRVKFNRDYAGSVKGISFIDK